MNSALASGCEAHEMATLAMRRLAHLIPCERASVTLFDFESDRYLVLAINGDGAPCYGPFGYFPMSDFPDIGDLLEGGCRLVESLPQAAAPTLLEQQMLRAGMQSYMMVPLIAHEELIGALDVEASRPGSFMPAHIRAARAMGGHLATMIRHAQLDSSLREVNAELQQAIRVRDEMIQDVSRLVDALLQRSR